MLKWNANFQIPRSDKQYPIVYIKYVNSEVVDDQYLIKIKMFSDESLTDEIKEDIIPMPIDFTTADEDTIYACLRTIFDNSVFVEDKTNAK
jgi:hypothetical protein